MAANQGKKIRKLYFDVELAGSVTNQTFLCTQFVASTPGDRYGSLLQAMEACTGSTPPQVKQQRVVSAWFQPTGLEIAAATAPVAFAVRFVQPTSNGVNKATLAGLPYVTIGGATVPNKIGNEAIYGTAGILRHFSVQVQKNPGLANGAAAVTTHGVLYVQRQHTIEV